jgi:hypothetical protein
LSYFGRDKRLYAITLKKLLSIWPFVTCPKKEAWDPIKCCVHPLFVVGP